MQFNLIDILKTKLSAGLGRVLAPINVREAPKRDLLGFMKADKGWVYSATSAIADEVGSIDLKLKLYNNGEHTDVTEMGIAPMDRLDNPNPFMTRYQLLKLYQKYLDLTGLCFWYTPRAAGGNKNPVAIYPLPPHKMTIVRSSNPEEAIAGFYFRNDKGEDVPLTTSEVVFFRELDLVNPYSAGYSPAFAADVAIDSSQYASEWNRDFFYNSAIPSGVLSTDKALTTEQFDKLASEWEVRHAGKSNAHKIAVLQKGLKFESIATTPRDADFANLKTMNRDEILGVYRVPRTAVGITDDVNRANAEATDYVFSRRVIKPRMRQLVDGLNKFYIPKFKLQGKYKFAFTDPTPKDETAAVDNAAKLFDRGSLNRDEIREVLGHDNIEDEGGKTYFMPLNYMPVDDMGDMGSDDPTPTPPKEDTENGEDNGSGSKKKIKKLKLTPLQKYRRQQNLLKKGTTNYHSKLKKHFAAQAKWINKTIESEVGKKDLGQTIITAILAANWQEQQDKLLAIMAAFMPNVVQRAADAAQEEIGLEVDFNLQNPEVQNWINNYALQEAKLIDQVTKEKLQKVISKGVAEGMGVPDLTKEITKTFTQFGKTRAKVIAHTEMAKAHSYGEMQVYERSNVVDKKEWFTAGIDVCPICVANEAEGVILLKQEFSSGHQHPPAHPNCRCVIIPHVAE